MPSERTAAGIPEPLLGKRDIPLCASSPYCALAGRESLSRLAASIMEYSTITISTRSRWGPNDIREDLRDLILKICADRKDLVFRISEYKIKHEEWLQDITSVIATG